MDRDAVAYIRALEGTEALGLPDGLNLVATVADPAGDQLARALEQIERGAARTLFTDRLRTVAGSFRQLMGLLEWLASAGADLVAADVQLDSATPAGRRMVSLLNEIDRWEREPDHPRRPRGRPGLSASSPELAERISSMREQGQSLHAIAEALNRDGVPTPRGGSAWRASSVQSALGYRRPRPPAPPPGGPEPGGPPHHKRGPKHHQRGRKPPPGPTPRPPKP